MAKPVKVELDCGDAFNTSVSPHRLPHGPPGPRGAGLLAATG